MIDVSTRTDAPPVVVTLVRGDLRELDALAAAARVAETLGATVVGCVLPGRRRAGLDLLQALSGGAVGSWWSWPEVVARLAAGRVRGLVIGGETWRSAPAAVWPALDRCALFVQRRQPASPARNVLVAADSPGTDAALSDRVRAMPGYPGLRVTVAYACVPAWAWSLTATIALPMFMARIRQENLPWLPALAEATGVCLQSTPLLGIAALARDLRPDLVVLGLHAHRLRVPALAHPTAWTLSRELPTDVLLCPVLSSVPPSGLAGGRRDGHG